MPEEIGEAASPEGGVLCYPSASSRGRGVRVCLPAGTDMAVEVSRRGVKELSKWCKENIGGRKGVEEFSSEETGSVSFVG